METIVKIAGGNVNPEKFGEELASSLGIQFSVTFAGFKQSPTDPHVMIRNSGKEIIGRRKDSTGNTFDLADPGEIRFLTESPLTPAENTTLDGLVSAHDPTVKSREQRREDNDAVALAIVTDNLKAANWAGLTNGQKTETLRRACQLLFRNVLFKDLDTND